VDVAHFAVGGLRDLGIRASERLDSRHIFVEGLPWALPPTCSLSVADPIVLQTSYGFHVDQVSIELVELREVVINCLLLVRVGASVYLGEVGIPVSTVGLLAEVERTQVRLLFQGRLLVRFLLDGQRLVLVLQVLDLLDVLSLDILVESLGSLVTHQNLGIVLTYRLFPLGRKQRLTLIGLIRWTYWQLESMLPRRVLRGDHRRVLQLGLRHLHVELEGFVV